MYKRFYSSTSKEDLSKLEEKERTQIILKIKQLIFPFPTSLNIKKMKGLDNFYRIKTGKLRIIFQINYEIKEIIIRKIGYRKDVDRFF